jgi:acyl-CoA-dependent ceramide synthase
MNEYQSTDSRTVEDHDVAQDWFHEDGSRIIGIEQKLQNTDRDDFHARSMMIRHKAMRKDESPLATCCAWLVEHQIGMDTLHLHRCGRLIELSAGLSVNLLIILALTHTCFPKARRHCRKFFELSYYNQESGEYTIGWDDACMVLYWIVLFTGLRAFFIDYVLLPLAQHAGIQKKKDLMRFAEQAWLLIYCMAFWSLGMVCNTPWHCLPLLTWPRSISCIIPTIGLTSKIYGRIGQTGRLVVC